MTVAPQPPHRRDPFAFTANPAAYVPRTATEAVLVRLEFSLRDGAPAMGLCGPPGSGKTLLLHVLAHRLDGDFQSLYVPYSKLEPEEFCQWVLAATNEPEGSDPESALRGRISRDAAMRFPAMLWMVDDADLLPEETLRLLVRLQADARGFLRLVLVRSERDPGFRFSRAGLVVEDVELEGAMSARDLARYVRTRLDRAPEDASSRARLEASFDRLRDLSGGNPARFHVAAAALLCARTLSCDTRETIDTESDVPATHRNRA